MSEPVRAGLAERLRLMAITPDLDDDTELLRRIEAAVQGGVTCVQVRDKRSVPLHVRRQRAAAVATLCRRLGVLCLVNDDADLAREVGADGVHVGPDDEAPASVRARMTPGFIVGGSAGTVERARELVAQGVDYLGVGAVFDARASKPNASAPRGLSVIRSIRDDEVSGRVPLVAIGGIDASNAGACLDAGAVGVAVIRAILGERDSASAAQAIARARA